MTKLFEVGAQFPPLADIERISKYHRMKAIFDGRQAEIYERATELLKDTPHAPQLAKLYIAVNLADILVTKPADLLVGEAPSFESGKPDDSTEQNALNRIVEENDIAQLLHETAIGAGIRGDAWIKTYYADRHDYSEVNAMGLDGAAESLEPIIEAVDAINVFPEMSRGSHKRFKAVNIAWVEWVLEASVPGIEKYAMRKDDRYTEVPYLNVERHLPGYIAYERYKLTEAGVVNTYGYPVSTYTLLESVSTGRDSDVEETGVNRPLVFHIPYKTVDDDWRGISGIEKMESVLAAINDRLVQIDYILWKHADPTAYGPDIDADSTGGIRFGGKYIPVSKDEATPGYMTWSAQLESAFKELDVLIALVFQMSETPQWLFGTTLSGQDAGGTGTSHTDGVAIKARFMPILSKVRRIRTHVDKAIRDALWTAMELENFANSGIAEFTSYDAVYPKVVWRDGIPKSEKEEAEIYAIRTGNKPTIDVKSAIKRMDGLDDSQSDEVITRIKGDETFVDSTIFNGGTGGGA